MPSSASLCLSPLPSIRALPSKLNPSFSWRNGALKLHKPSSLSTFNPRSLREPKALVVTKDSWEESILNSQIPVLVEFYASWCGPCRMVHRAINEIAEDYAGKLRCFVLNTDDDLRIAEDCEIKAVPVVLLFKNGVKRESIVGTMPKEFYIAAIERVLRS